MKSVLSDLLTMLWILILLCVGLFIFVTAFGVTGMLAAKAACFIVGCNQ